MKFKTKEKIEVSNNYAEIFALLDVMQPGLCDAIVYGFEVRTITVMLAGESDSAPVTVELTPPHAQSFIRWLEKRGMCSV